MDAEVTGESEKVSSQEYERIRRELAKVNLLCSRPQVKYGFIAKYRTIWPTRTVCRLLGVSSSARYDWFGRPASAHERENAQLLKATKYSYKASDGTYDSPHVVRDLVDAGFACSENREARLMKAAGNKARQWRNATASQRSVRYSAGKRFCSVSWPFNRALFSARPNRTRLSNVSGDVKFNKLLLRAINGRNYA